MSISVSSIQRSEIAAASPMSARLLVQTTKKKLRYDTSERSFFAIALLLTACSTKPDVSTSDKKTQPKLTQEPQAEVSKAVRKAPPKEKAKSVPNKSSDKKVGPVLFGYQTFCSDNAETRRQLRQLGYQRRHEVKDELCFGRFWAPDNGREKYKLTLSLAEQVTPRMLSKSYRRIGETIEFTEFGEDDEDPMNVELDVPRYHPDINFCVGDNEIFSVILPSYKSLQSPGPCWDDDEAEIEVLGDGTIYNPATNAQESWINVASISFKGSLALVDQTHQEFVVDENGYTRARTEVVPDGMLFDLAKWEVEDIEAKPIDDFKCEDAFSIAWRPWVKKFERAIEKDIEFKPIEVASSSDNKLLVFAEGTKLAGGDGFRLYVAAE